MHGILQSDNINLNNNQKENLGKYDINENGYFNDIGRWGEKYVLKSLKEEFKDNNSIEIIDLNGDGKTGVGADFVVQDKNSNVVKLVEVKTTTQPRGSKVEVSGIQWETARYYFNTNDGDLYWIYCVYNAGNTNPEIIKIQNSLKNWKKGLLFADPVSFIVY